MQRTSDLRFKEKVLRSAKWYNLASVFTSTLKWPWRPVGGLVLPSVKAAKHLLFSMLETVFGSGEMGVLPCGQLECEYESKSIQVPLPI